MEVVAAVIVNVVDDWIRAPFTVDPCFLPKFNKQRSVVLRSGEAPLSNPPRSPPSKNVTWRLPNSSYFFCTVLPVPPDGSKALQSEERNSRILYSLFSDSCLHVLGGLYFPFEIDGNHSLHFPGMVVHKARDSGSPSFSGGERYPPNKSYNDWDNESIRNTPNQR